MEEKNELAETNQQTEIALPSDVQAAIDSICPPQTQEAMKKIEGHIRGLYDEEERLYTKSSVLYHQMREIEEKAIKKACATVKHASRKDYDRFNDDDAKINILLVQAGKVPKEVIPMLNKLYAKKKGTKAVETLRQRPIEAALSKALGIEGPFALSRTRWDGDQWAKNEDIHISIDLNEIPEFKKLWQEHQEVNAAKTEVRKKIMSFNIKMRRIVMFGPRSPFFW